MPFRTLLAYALLGASLVLSHQAGAAQSTDLTAATALQAGAAPGQARYELGAVVDARQANAKGAALLAITPGGAADRMGLQAGDRLRAINGQRLDDTPMPSSALERALQEGNGMLQIEALRNGKPLLLSGRADLAVGGRQGDAKSCGYVTDREGVVPRSEDIFNVEITQIEGRSTPLIPANRHRVESGKRVLVVRELIAYTHLNSAQLAQIKKMKKFAFARAYKSFVLDVKPNMSYRIGARLIKDKLDTQSIRDNAYWEPVVWEVVPEACS
ncbi:MAG: PDZ domain-containing protein [Pseudoxanthomonas sp.]